MKKILLTATLGALVCLALPARADVITEVDYFHCAANQSTPIVTANSLLDSTVPSWNGNAPASSMTFGAGCVGVTDLVFNGVDYKTPYDTPFEGYFTGNIDSITIRAYLGAIRGLRQNVTMRVLLGIDGKSLFGEDTSATGNPGPASKTISVTPVLMDNGLSLVEFTITKIGFTEEPGTGDTEHVVNIALGSSSEPVTLLFLDSTEAPSGLTINPLTPAKAVLKATTPGPA